MAGTDVYNRTAAGPWGPVRQRGAGKLGRVLSHLLDLLLPVDCGGCGVPGAVLCGDCEALLGAPIRVHPPSCPATPPVYALGTYHGPLRAAVLAYKERGRRDLATPLGTALASALLHPHIAHPSPTWSHIGVEPATKSPICLHVGKEIWMVPVPSTPAAAGRRGGQHVALLARRAAAALAGAGVAAAVAPALRMAAGVRDSVGLTASARRANLAGRVLARRAGLPPAGTPVVLVDDVVTTGATAAACTAALVRTGIAVSAIVVLAAAGRHTAL
ncbi:MAG TPA: ComF family protein [Pseudonocardiaceae bacterium]|jgi:predicted amidophosphoribosyltransferase|nr:ComF family protein [Pseudonocardiaceae bacterium]